MSRDNSTLWKHASDKNGNAVLLTSVDFGDGVEVVNADTGEVLEVANFDTIANGGRWHYRFSRPGKAYKNVFIIGKNGKAIYLGNGDGDSYDFKIQQAKQNSGYTQEHGKGKYDFATLEKSAGPDYVYEGNGGYSNVDGILGSGNVAAPILLDPALAGKEVEFTDPVSTLREIAKENQGIVNENTLLGMQQAGLLSEGDLAQLTRYLNTMSPLQRQLVGIENAFNAQQKLQAAETAQPGITDLLRGEVKNAQTLASGRLLRDAEDRALEQTARSAGADAAWTRGLGDDSLVGKRLSDQLSVSQRLGIMQAGQNYMNASVQLANATLMDTPNKAALSQQIPGTPMNAFSTIAAQQQASLNQFSTINGEAAVNAQTTNYWNYINKNVEIAAANTQAMNEYNQNVINDQNQTALAESKAQAYNYAYWLYQHDHLSEDELAQVQAQIEATGSFDPTTIYKDFYKEYRKEQANGRSSTLSGETSHGNGQKTTDENGNRVTTYADGSKIIQYNNKMTIQMSGGETWNCEVVKYLNADGSGRLVIRHNKGEIGVINFNSDKTITGTSEGNRGINLLEDGSYDVSSYLNDGYSPGAGSSSGSGEGTTNKIYKSTSNNSTTSDGINNSTNSSNTTTSTTPSQKMTTMANNIINTNNKSTTYEYRSWNDLVSQYLGNSINNSGGVINKYNYTPTSPSVSTVLNPTYVQGKIVQKNGAITLPVQNKNYKVPVTYLDYLTLSLLNS